MNCPACSKRLTSGSKMTRLCKYCSRCDVEYWIHSSGKLMPKDEYEKKNTEDADKYFNSLDNDNE